MTSEKKKKEVESIKKLMLKYRVISIGDITSLPSRQFQSMRAKLKDKVVIKVTKKRLVQRAIESLKEKDLKPLEKYLENIIPVLLFTDEDPFKLYKLLKKSKSRVAAKPGQMAPSDIVVNAGPTNFPPGPIIGELGQVGIVASVEAGKIAIKKDTTIVKAGHVINEKQASIMAKLGIEPMEIGLNIVGVYDNGILYERSSLDFDEEKLMNDMKMAHHSALSLALKIGYMTKETIKLLIARAVSQAKALESKLNLGNFDVAEEDIPSREKDDEINLKKADYDKDSEKAREILDKIKDEGTIKKYKEPEYKPSPIKTKDLIKEE